MRKRNLLLEVVTLRRKKKNKALKWLITKAREDLALLRLEGNRFKKAHAEAVRDLIKREVELESTRKGFQELRRKRASVVRQRSKLLFRYFELNQEVQCQKHTATTGKD